MTAADAASLDGRLYCYRHPDRETYVRCGRCDQPICTRCAMIGPVGLRCRKCGTPARDPLSHLTPAQLALGSATSIGAGVFGGLIGLRIGIFAIFIGPIIGGTIAEAVLRVSGYKRGSLMYGVVGGGIVIGVIAAAALQFRLLFGGFANADLALDAYVGSVALDGLIYVAAAMVGAFSRLR
jgi:hypothetical protein